jgi:ATP-dependent RNA helicase DDX27
MPNELSRYIHRVGRTARIGNIGTSISFAEERSRNILKLIVKRAKVNNETVKQRKIATESILYYQKKIEKLENDIKELDQQYKLEQEVNKNLTKVQKSRHRFKEGRKHKQVPRRDYEQA